MFLRDCLPTGNYIQTTFSLKSFVLNAGFEPDGDILISTEYRRFCSSVKVSKWPYSLKKNLNFTSSVGNPTQWNIKHECQTFYQFWALQVVSTYSGCCIYMFALPVQTSVLQTFYTHVNIMPRFLYEPVHSSVFVLQNHENVSCWWPSVSIISMFFYEPLQAIVFVLQNVSCWWPSMDQQSADQQLLYNKLAHKLFGIQPWLTWGQTISQSPSTALTDSGSLQKEHRMHCS